MTFFKTALAAVAVAGTMAGAALGFGAAVASADPVAPPNAPRKPTEVWLGQPVVWAWLPAGGHWGIWINGDFLPLT